MTEPARPLTYHQVDAFTTRAFGGNPAAVFVLEDWLDDTTLAAIAAEHNLSETAFVVPGAHGRHGLRWFTPTCEVELCGHATLASAHVLLCCLDGYAAPLRFLTRRAGELGVAATDGMLWLDFPTRPAAPCEDIPAALIEGLGAPAREWRAAQNYLAVFDDAASVTALAPDMSALAAQAERDDRGVIATAPAAGSAYADRCDFVSRCFFPGHGVDEDPVTGSAHCTLAPYWSERLGRATLTGRQVSRRGGTVVCQLDGDRVHLGGHAVRYARGQAYLPPPVRVPQ